MTTSSGRPLLGPAILARWRNLRLRVRVAIALILAGICAAAGFLAFRSGAETWPPRRVIIGSGPARPLAFSPDGAVLVTHDAVGLSGWDPVSGTMIGRWEGLSERRGSRGVFRGEFTPDGRSFFVLSRSANAPSSPMGVHTIDPETGRGLVSISLDQSGWIGHAISRDGSSLRVVTIGPQDTRVADVHLQTGQKIAIRPVTIPSVGFPNAVSPDGRYLALAQAQAQGGAKPGISSDVLVWDLDLDRQAFRIAGTAKVSGLGFSPDGKTLAVGREARGFDLLDLSTGGPIATYTPHPTDYDALSFAFSPDGSTIVSTGQWIRTGWGVGSAKRLIAGHLRDPSWLPPADLAVLNVRTGRVLGHIPAEGRVTFSPDGKTLATAHPEGKIRLRDIPPP